MNIALPGVPEISSSHSPSHTLAFLSGGGEMGERMRALDWSRTPLGSPDNWPASLRASVSICLNCAFPILIWWGPEFVMLYNDEYRPILGSHKHPLALGSPGAKVWPEIWSVVGPMLERVMGSREPARARDLLLMMDRFGYTEETYFSFSYSPISDESGAVAGVFCPVIETTQKVISERRLKILRELASLDYSQRSVHEVCSAISEALKRAAHDVPFALIYLLDEQEPKCAQLCAASGIESGEAAAPTKIDMSQPADGSWPLQEAAAGQHAVLVQDLQRRFAHLPVGAWDRRPAAAWILPIILPGQAAPLAFLVAAVSPARELDPDYETFYGLLADQVRSAIASAEAVKQERRRAEELSQLDRAKTAFFSNVSHEFRTPLTLMLGPIEEASRSAEIPPQVRQRLELAQRNSLRLLKLVNSLLDFSRIEAGRVQAAYEPVDLAQLTGDLASTFRSAMERAGLAFHVECQALGEPIYVDRDMWEKIVLNVLSNAFKFTLDGNVTVRLRRDAMHALLEVSDTGVGVPAEELPRLFERFHRVEGVAGRTQEGSGIGLALVQELVKLHGGTIDVTSEHGSGTTFTIRIPFGTAHLRRDRIRATKTRQSTAVTSRAFVEEALRWIPTTSDNSSQVSRLPEQPGRRGDARFAHTSGARILLADDNADIRSYVHDLLSPMYAVKVVSDGRQALQAAKREPPDLILSDIMMPRLDGIELLKAVRADATLREVPVILLSARAGEEARVEGLDGGADDYLVKPFSARELLARVGALLELTRMRQQSEERFAAFVRATSEVVYRMNADWSEMRFLQGRNFIADTEDPSRGWLEKYIHPDDRPEILAAIQQAIRTKSPFRLEHRVLRVDGSFGWTASRAIPLLGDDGEITEWLGAATDVTERKWAERLALGQRQILEKVATGAPLSDTLDDLIRFLEEQEPGARCALLMVTGDGRHLRAASAPSLPPSYKQALDGVAVDPPYVGSSGETVDRCQTVMVPDVAMDTNYAPEWRSLLLGWGCHAVRSTPVRGTDGRVIGSLALYFDHPRDPTPSHPQLIELGTHLAAIAIERDRAVRELRNSREQLQSIVNNSPIGVYLVDSEFRICEVNPIARLVFGEIPDLIGRDFSEVMRLLWPQAYAAEVVGLFQHTLKTGEPHHTPERIEERLDRGVTEYYEWQIHRVPLPGGTHGVACYFRDISAEVHARRALEHADRQKDEFLAMLAHELRNPLAPIGNASEILSRVIPPDAPAQMAVSMIKRQAKQLTRLVDDLLDVSRITQGRIQLHRAPIDVAAIIAQAVETVEPQMREKQHRLSVTASTSYEPLYVNGDPARLLQCVVNVLANAAKYTDAGGAIALSTRAEERSVLIEVKDTGVGIPPDLLPRVFDLFVQSARTLDRSQGGLGIGLAVVKRLVEMHGGEVRARSAGTGQGATFEIRLPRTNRPQLAKRDANTPQLPRRRVLIVDDNVDAANSTVFLLTLRGHQAQAVYSAADALERVQSFQPDAALLDIGLPQMSGYELAREIRALSVGKRIRLVALTGYGQTEDHHRSVEAGFDAHLVKPVDLDVLESALTEVHAQAFSEI